MGEGSWVSGSTAASTAGAASEVRVESGTGGERAVKSSDCERTGVRVGAEGERDRSVAEVDGQAGPLPLACSRALANACRLAKRCCGSLARAIIITFSTSGAIIGSFSCKDGGEAKTCWLAISVKEP